MKAGYLTALLIGATALSACATDREEIVAPAPPTGPGAIAGTVAADSNGDGIVDGYYTPDGVFHPISGPPCPPPPPPPPPTPRGERG
ncbi:hypothetical protein M0208_13235 [Sphingomonas sp. SUN019]|uniref:hypothetical protein n=1 Tax=Sphingomonas sp. SUN019 TaxID=2937788 RepID=UPI0021643A58|nr:hypothetical protein [Sphingomonas sp. SUN019]UVO51420.1 hypothetical protein M0208_13235 [Sphingomonas sp. SUN019]